MKRIALPMIKPEVWFWTITLLFLIAGILMCWLIWQHPARVGLIAGTAERGHWLTGLMVGTGIVALCALMSFVGTRLSGRKQFDEIRQQARGDDIPAPEKAEKADVLFHGESSQLKNRLRRRYGFFWRGKIRLLMVVGEPAEIAALVPGLTAQVWLEGQRTVLLHGGSLHAAGDGPRLDAWRTLRRPRPLDGVVWALTGSQSQTPQWMDNGLRSLEKTGRALRYQPPVYLWQICDSAWPQSGRAEQPVGALFPDNADPQTIERQIQSLSPQLREQGMQQVFATGRHDFLLRLAQSLAATGAARWRRVLTPWCTESARRIPLRGLMFSLPDVCNPTIPPMDAHKNAWTAPASWQGVLDDCRTARGRRVGLPWEQTLCFALLTLVVLWGAGGVVSFAVNRHQMVAAAGLAHRLTQPRQVADEQLIALLALRNDIGRLQTWVANGAPWYQRFGLDYSERLLNTLMPWYGHAGHRLIRDAAAASLRRKLSVLVNLPANSPKRAALARAGYDQLKAYLMMARPEKADAAFYVQVMITTEPVRPGVTHGLWQRLAPDLWRFYALNLPAQPGWKITPDRALVYQARQVLLGEIGQRNAESTLYKNMLLSVSRHYADMTLTDMTGSTDAQRLFNSKEVVPGIFTRKAWDEQIQQAIDNAAASRREEIDWVLSDDRRSVCDDISPEALKKRLTARYFNDFAGSWLKFLNSLRWNDARNLSEVIDQLTLMSDVRQSPLIALMNQLAWQGQTGQKARALTDSLVKSAKALINSDSQPAIDQRADAPAGPLDEIFGPLLALMGKGGAQSRTFSDSSLSLQTLLTRVTRVRLKLQQIANASDPREMAQILAQTVFRGKSVDLTDTQAYGSLIAASLGEEWNSFGHSLFVQPLAQAWETVLHPSSASLNDQWNNTVVAHWKSAFDGRYPFAIGNSDASLSMLAEFIRKDSGHIDRFLARELRGILHKEGTQWVPDRVNSQGLAFNPAFLAAINQLRVISDILFTDGSQGMRFELLARPVPNVVETHLSIDGQKLIYFNQMASWQRFRWPGDTYKPGAMLAWTEVNAGARLYGDYQGTWGLIRWLEQAQRQKLDEGRYQLTFATAEQRPLQWILRTELGEGPLGLLQLRDFTLPGQIFMMRGASAHAQ